MGKYKWKTFGDVFKEIENCARGYLTLNMLEISVCEEQEFKFIGIYAKNREEYIVAEMAGYLLGATVVPLYDTLGLEGLQFIAQQTQLKTMFSSAEGLIKMSKMENSGIIPMVSNIIVFDELIPEFEADLRKNFPKLVLIPYIMVLKAGNSSGIRLKRKDRAKGESIGLICYTSGTTGLPKGVMLSHKNMVAGAAGLATVDYMSKLTNNDAYTSYLPMAHVYERILLTNCYIFGTKIGIFGGDITKLANDLATLQPTVFNSVPRLFYRFYSVINQKLDALKGFKKKMCGKALKVKLARVRKTAICTHSLYDKLVFNKMKGILGGKVKFIGSGGAPIDQTVLEFLKVCFCCPIMEGFGQTETFAAGGAGCSDDPLAGHAGPPYVSMEYKLMDVPDMEYFVTDKEMWEGVETSIPRGELLMRSPAVFQGYFLNKQKTLQTIQGGWLYTGDIAKFLPGGRMKIIDRKNNFFKLSQGEYIASEKLENVYSVSPYVSQIFVYGDGMRDFLVAIAVPDEAYILSRAKELGIYLYVFIYIYIYI